MIKDIAIDMKTRPESWNGLSFLNSKNTSNWDRILFKIIRIQPGGWETDYTSFVAFVKALKNNWFKSIPDLLKDLEPYEIGVEDFFKLERKVTFKLASLIADINILQKEILKDKQYDISNFARLSSHAFLPTVVYQLEEFGLPRMLSKKIHQSKLINFYNKDLTLHSAIDLFKEVGIEKIYEHADLEDFDYYILDYFYEGLQTNK